MARLESGERVVVFIITIAVPAIVVWFWIGDKPGAEIRALASLGAAFIAVFIVFFWNVIRLPAVLAAEQEAEIARLAEQGETAETMKHRREAIGQLLAEANGLASAFCSEQPVEPIIAAVDDWRKRAAKFADIDLDGANRALLWSDAGIVCSIPNLPEDRSGRWLWITYRAIRLQKIIETL